MHDPGDVIDLNGPQSRSVADLDAGIPISGAEAEDEVTRAQAHVEAARTRLEQLRKAAETAPANDVDRGGGDAVDAARRRAKSSRKRPRRLCRPGRKAVAGGVGIVLASASLAASGYMVWQHRSIEHKRQLTQEYAAAARHGVTALMSIDANHAKQDLQRILDASTGDLKSQLSVLASRMAKQAEDSKVSSTVTVQAVAVESVSDDSGVVLVAAKSDATGPENAKRPPALWRLSININRDNGQLKMSKVDFLQ